MFRDYERQFYWWWQRWEQGHVGGKPTVSFRYVDVSPMIYSPGSPSTKISSFDSHPAPKIQYRDAAKINHVHTFFSKYFLNACST